MITEPLFQVKAFRKGLLVFHFFLDKKVEQKIKAA